MIEFLLHFSRKVYGESMNWGFSNWGLILTTVNHEGIITMKWSKKNCTVQILHFLRQVTLTELYKQILWGYCWDGEASRPVICLSVHDGLSWFIWWFQIKKVNCRGFLWLHVVSSYTPQWEIIRLILFFLTCILFFNAICSGWPDKNDRKRNLNKT